MGTVCLNRFVKRHCNQDLVRLHLHTAVDGGITGNWSHAESPRLHCVHTNETYPYLAQHIDRQRRQWYPRRYRHHWQTV